MVSESGRPVVATAVEAVKLDKTSFSDAAAMLVVVIGRWKSVIAELFT